MAQSSAFKTYDAVGQREDLTDAVSIITRHETPIFADLQKVKAKARQHDWQLDTLSTGSDNAQIEGADFSFALPGARTRAVNYTQIFTKTLEVSETLEEVDIAGTNDEFEYQLEKRMKEIATDVEKALITGTGNSGASGTARRLRGILSFIATNVTTGTGTGNETLTETMFNDNLQLIWAAGGRPDTAYVNGSQKRKISSFSSPNQRYVEITGEGELKASIAAYDSDFGRITVKLNPFMDTDKVLLLQKDLWAVAVLRGIKPREVPSIGDSKRGALVGELTLEARNEAGNGQITQLS